VTGLFGLTMKSLMNGKSMSLIGKLYHSREDRVAELNDELSRVQYDNLENDLARIEEAGGAFVEYVDGLEDAITEYMESMQDTSEDAPSRMGYARRDLIEKWTLTQATLSKVAWVLRIDGNDAYQRMINALKNGEAVDMRGL
jgi:hypothetical protein